MEEWNLILRALPVEVPHLAGPTSTRSKCDASATVFLRYLAFDMPFFDIRDFIEANRSRDGYKRVRPGPITNTLVVVNLPLVMTPRKLLKVKSNNFRFLWMQANAITPQAAGVGKVHWIVARVLKEVWTLAEAGWILARPSTKRRTSLVTGLRGPEVEGNRRSGAP